MEGSVDFTMKKDNIVKKKTKNIVYTGALFERYGLEKLITAFLKINDADLRLHFYGEGPMVNNILDYSRRDERIAYKGVLLNKDLVIVQLDAYLLVNPRPTNEELCLY